MILDFLFFILRMMVLGRGLIFQPALTSLPYTHYAHIIMTPGGKGRERGGEGGRGREGERERERQRQIDRERERERERENEDE